VHAGGCPAQVDGQPLQLVIPHALQMEWTKRPGYFCAATERTGQDILQALIDAGTVLPRQTSPDTKRRWQMSALYAVDDYILAAVENHSGTALAHTGKAALSAHNPWPIPHAKLIRTHEWPRSHL
jgi:hypothetical protein